MEAFAKAEIAKYTEQERNEYEDSLKTYRDLKGVIDTAFDEGKLEGKLEIAKNIKFKGLKLKDISDITGLSMSDIEQL